MSDARQVLRHVHLSDQTYRVGDVAPTAGRFVAVFEAKARTESITEFPRTWSQLEAVVESRLADFEARHHSECEQAFERGRAEGHREQEANVLRRLDGAGEPWRAIQAAVRRELAAYREELYRGTTELASALARAWLGNIVELNSRVFETGVRKALDALGHQEEIEVRLHPEDFKAFRSGLDDRDSSLWESPDVTVVADPSVDRGGAVAVSRGGTSDARLSVRVQKALEWLALPHDQR